ncbi:MAG: cation:proton antiporter subunit C [Candidatus Thiodiazotropha sp.]
MNEILGHFNYLIVVLLMMMGLYVVIASPNLIKKLIGLSLFQASVFILFITFGKVSGGGPPILSQQLTAYSNPLPHVLILTAIVVGVATTAVGLALIVRVYEAYGTTDEDEIDAMDNADDKPVV